MAGIGATEEQRGRTITKTLTGYEGKRIFVGPQTTIVSDLGLVANSAYIGAQWPQDFAYSGWTLVSNAAVTQIDLTYEFGAVDAEATVTYSSEPRGGGSGKDIDGKLVNTYYDELTTTVVEGDVGAKEEVDGLVAQFNDANGKDITTQDVIVNLPSAVVTRYYWYDHEPSFGSIYAMTGKINSVTFVGAAASYFLCIGADVGQIENDKWEGRFAFQLSPFNAFQQAHWNQTKTDKDGKYMRLYSGIDFASQIVLF